MKSAGFAGLSFSSLILHPSSFLLRVPPDYYRVVEPARIGLPPQELPS
jgi:hypothetical protein